MEEYLRESHGDVIDDTDTDIPLPLRESNKFKFRFKKSWESDGDVIDDTVIKDKSKDRNSEKLIQFKFNKLN